MTASRVIMMTVVAMLALAVFASPIKSLPGYDGELPVMDSGYISVSDTKNIFYWFIESSNKPETDPLVLWFTGGPGCSGVSALMTENGPFQVDPQTGDLVDNDWSWTRAANVIWFEQPCGVGYSYSDKRRDYVTNDTQAADDNYVFLQNWLAEFPEFQGRDLWFVGESYAGMYIPTLAYQVLTGDDQALASQLQGLMLGNPVIFCNSFGMDSPGFLPLQFNKFFYAGLLSFSTYQQWQQLGCDAQVSFSCRALFAKAQRQIGAITQQLRDAEMVALSETHGSADLDTDDLYQDFCTGNGTLDQTFDPNADCRPLGDVTTDYLNRADVQTALHARAGTKWSTCSDRVLYTSNLAHAGSDGMIEYLRKILKLDSAIDILYYSGDVDMATVPTQTTQACLSELSDIVEPVQSWNPWTINGWHAGYVESFNKYTFATVKGAGHEVPSYQPAIAYNMFERFLTKQSLADTTNTVRHPSSHVRASQSRALYKQFSM